MTILTRYLLRSYFPTFLLCLGVFLFVLLMNYFLRLFNLAVMKGIPLEWIFLCFARLLPYFLSLALPMAFLVALLLTLAQLSQSGEVMALRSSGFSFRDILTPFFAVAVGVTGLLFYVNHKASPDGFNAFKDSYTRVVAQVSNLEFEERALTRLGDWELYAEGAEAGTGKLKGVRIVKRQGNYQRLRISAPEGRARLERGVGVGLELSGGALVWPNDDPASHTVSTFRRSRLFIPFVDYSKVHRNPDLQELSTGRLRRRLGDPGLTPQKRREYTTETALRSAGAAAPFVLFWVACPLGLRLERRSLTMGFALSLLVMFVYYGLLAFGIGIGRRTLALSAWGPWLPDAACLACGAGLWWAQLRR
ncbi:MAG: LptF/LptG family permease [Elusimicrobiota bacterium]